MRTLIIAGFLSIFLPLQAQSAKSIFSPDLPYKTLTVKYKISGTEKGSEVLYMRKNGLESVKIRKTKGKFLFQNIGQNSIEIVTSDDLIMVDLNKNKATKVTNPRVFMEQEYEKLSEKEKKIVQKNAKKMGVSSLQMLKGMGGDFKEKGGEHLGYECDIFSFMGMKTYQMSGTPIILKIENHMMGMNTNQSATSFEKNSSIPADVFTPPAGITPKYNKEMDDMNRQMAVNIVNMLKDPEAGDKMDKAMEDAGKESRRAREEEQAREEEYEDDEEEDYNRDRRRSRDRDRDQEEEEDEDDDPSKKLDDAINKGKELFKGLF